MKYLLFLIILICCSCTVKWKDEEQNPEHVTGIWFSEGEPCKDVFILKNEDIYLSGRVCHLFDDSFGAEAEYGNYDLSRDSIKLFPEFSSCSKAVFDSESNISISDTAFVLDGLEYSQSGNVNIFFGCINNNEFESTNILFPHLKD